MQTDNRILSRRCGIASCPAAETAKQILSDALSARGLQPDAAAQPGIRLAEDPALGRDCYRIACGATVTLTASGTRGWLYAIGLLLRRLIPCAEGARLIADLTGDYAPVKEIRGHQLGYRRTPNTYDAWTVADFRRYSIELAFFGVNTIEHIPYQDGHSDRNRLMRYDEEDLLVAAANDLEALDLNLSLWFPNMSMESDAAAAARHGRLYARLPRLDAVMIPGSDPGDLPVDALMRRCRAISAELRKHHPQAKLWLSAQQPHNQPDWGADFVAAIQTIPPEIDGIVMGPNHAYPLPELREKIPANYPIRFYPDITHNVRCEYPVHYKNDDWHFALSAALGRECTNPRPAEYAALHAETAPYICGSVSYSEGVTDDVNKMIWSDLDYFGARPVREILLDYARLFFYGAAPERIADAILSLERNWIGDPAENAGIDDTSMQFQALRNAYPFLMQNWRFVQLLLRADCDRLLRERRRFELQLIAQAAAALQTDGIPAAIAALTAPFSADYIALRAEIDALCAFLFDAVGLQTDIEHYCAENPERGAILETIDLPITDRAWLLQKLQNETDPARAMRYFTFTQPSPGNVFYSVALHGLAGAGTKQTGEFYLNARGDFPGENNGRLPTAFFTAYDHFSFDYVTDQLLPGAAYRLRLIVKDRRLPAQTDFSLTANGLSIYRGPLYGGEPDPAYDALFCPDGYHCVCYAIPAACNPSGRLVLKLREPSAGIQIAALALERIEK